MSCLGSYCWSECGNDRKREVELGKRGGMRTKKVKRQDAHVLEGRREGERDIEVMADLFTDSPHTEQAPEV